MSTQTPGVQELVPARLLELVAVKTPWHRSLWQPGSILMLREVLEYADGLRAGGMNSDGLTFACAAARAQVDRDLGLGAEPIRERISEVLKSGADKNRGLVQRSVSDTLEQLIRRGEHQYLRRWASAVRLGQVNVGDAELLSRLAAAHLLDAGFALEHIHGWLMNKKGAPLEDLLEMADEMCNQDAQEFEVLVPFSKLPAAVVKTAGDRFRNAEATEEFLAARGSEHPEGRRGTGSLTFRVTAREPWSAIAAVDTEIRRLSARVAVGLRNKAVVPLGTAMVLDSGHNRWRDLESRERLLLVTAIERHGLLLPAKTQEVHELDDALELLAAVKTSTSWASVAAIWAAVEGLLSRATDKGTLSADRMAAVVAASFVRAELVLLATKFKTADHPVGNMLREEDRAFSERLDELFELIAYGAPMPQMTFEDAAAIMRLRSIIADVTVLSRIEEYLKAAFRRLYQQRNLLLHGGRFDSVALPLTMRTVPVLVAAGLDRLVFAVAEEQNTTPLGLAARARTEISLLGHDGARELHRLID